MNTVRAELKRLHSPDVFDIDEASIDHEKPFSVLVQAMFGPRGSEGEESFDVVVCNPEWVEQIVRVEGLLSGRHHLIMSRFDATRIREFLTAAANESSGSTWREVAEKLSRIGKWEFEDYAA